MILNKNTFNLSIFTILIVIYSGLFMVFTQILELIGIPQGIVPVKSSLFLLLLIFLFFLSIYNKKLNISLLKITSLYLFTGALILESIILVFLHHLPIKYILFTLYDSWSVIPLSILFTFAIANIKLTKLLLKKIFLFLVFLSVLIGIIAILQHVLNQSILPISRANFIIGGEIRAYSLFNSPKSFSLFFIMLFYLIILNIKITRNSYKKVFYFMFLCFTVYMIYIAKIRGTYILFLASFFFYISTNFYIKLFSFNKVLKIQYIVAISILILIISLIAIIASLNMGTGLFNVNSLVDRFYFWNILFTKLDINLINSIFGFGLIQNDGGLEIVNNLFGDNKFIMDNTFLQLYFWGGAIILVTFFYLYIKISNLLKISYYSTKDRVVKNAIVMIFSLHLSFLFLFLVSRSISEYFLFVYIPTVFIVKYIKDEYCKIIK